MLISFIQKKQQEKQDEKTEEARQRILNSDIWKSILNINEKYIERLKQFSLYEVEYLVFNEDNLIQSIYDCFQNEKWRFTMLNTQEQKRQCIYMYYQCEINKYRESQIIWDVKPKVNQMFLDLLNQLIDEHMIQNQETNIKVQVRSNNITKSCQVPMFDVFTLDDFPQIIKLN